MAGHRGDLKQEHLWAAPLHLETPAGASAVQEGRTRLEEGMLAGCPCP